MDIEYLYLLQQFREATNSVFDSFFLYVSDFGMWQPFILIVMVALVMFSRNYLGVHTPQDVCIGLLTGIVFTFLSVRVLAWVEEGKNRDLVVALIGYAASAALLVFVINKTYPLDYVDGTLIVDPVKMMPDSFLCAGMLGGFLTGWIWERRWICFEIPESGVEKVSRYIPGAIVTAFLMYAAVPVCRQFVGVNWGGFLAMFIVLLFCTGIYPSLFRKRK